MSTIVANYRRFLRIQGAEWVHCVSIVPLLLGSTPVWN